jgi:hypothetical protein
MTYRTQGSLLGCGCGMNGLGGLGAVAGSVSGLASLEEDIRLVSVDMRRAFGNFRFDQAAFNRLAQRGRDGNLTRMTRDEQKQFIAGIVGKAARAAATIKQLGLRDVRNDTERQQNLQAQANLLREARALWTTAHNMMRDARPAAGTSGMGEVILIIVAIAAVTFLAAYGMTIWSDMERLDQAQQYADRVCTGCSPEQRAEFIRTLTDGRGPIAEAAGAVAKEIAPIIAAGVGGVLLLGGVIVYLKYGRKPKAAQDSRPAGARG